MMRSVARRDFLGLAAGSMAGTVIGASPAAGQDATAGWTQFQYDAQNRGTASFSGPKRGVRRRWEFSTFGEAPVENAPVVADGTVFAGSQDGNVYALDAATGEERWRLETGSVVRSTPAVADGVVYVGSDNGKLHALNAETGDHEWTYRTRDGGDVNVRVTVADGTVFAPAEGVVALDAATGERRWQTDRSPGAGLAVADGTVFFAEQETNRVFAHDATDGTVRWRNKIDGRANYYFSPTVANGRLLLGTNDGRLHALDSSNGETLWRFDTGADDGIFSSPAVADGVAYLGSGTWEKGDADRAVFAVDLATGEERWRFDTRSAAIGSPIVLDGVVYANAHDDQFYALSADDGSVLWQHELSDDFLGSPAAANGDLFVLTRQGYVVALTETQGSTATTERDDLDAAYSYSPEDPDPGQTVTFDASPSAVPPDSNPRYRWDFDEEGGFEADAEGKRVRHAYDEPGTYTAALVVEVEGRNGERFVREISVGDGGSSGGTTTEEQTHRGFFSNDPDPDTAGALRNPFFLTVGGFVLSVAGVAHQMLRGR